MKEQLIKKIFMVLLKDEKFNSFEVEKKVNIIYTLFTSFDRLVKIVESGYKVEVDYPDFTLSIDL